MSANPPPCLYYIWKGFIKMCVAVISAQAATYSKNRLGCFSPLRVAMSRWDYDASSKEGAGLRVQEEEKTKQAPPEENTQPPKEEPQPPNDEPPSSEEPVLDFATTSAARAYWMYRWLAQGKGSTGPRAIIWSDKADDDALWEYFKTECAFSGAEIYVEFELDVLDSAIPLHGSHRCPNAAERWWTSQDASDSAKKSEYPMARIHHGQPGDYDLRQHFRKHRTFAGAWVHIQPFSTTNTDSSDDEAWEWHEMLHDCRLQMNYGYT